MKLIPIASDGFRFILPLAAAAGVLLWIGRGWGMFFGSLLLVLAAFCAFFFRDLDRATRADVNFIYSPADGRVVEVVQVPAGSQTSGFLVRIFLSVFDGHVQRSPVAGKIKEIRYTPGKFLDARNPKAHVENEQNALVFMNSHGPVIVTQIAGLIARRIVCWAKEGDTFQQGERFGLIRFGSQVDVSLPQNTEIVVKPGDRVLGGETILAKWKT